MSDPHPEHFPSEAWEAQRDFTWDLQLKVSGECRFRDNTVGKELNRHEGWPGSSGFCYLRGIEAHVSAPPRRGERRGLSTLSSAIWG